MRITVLFLTILSVLVSGEVESLSPQIAEVFITAKDHACPRCNSTLPRAIQEANPGATNVRIWDKYVSFKPSYQPVDWNLLRRRFKEYDRDIIKIELKDRAGKVIATQ